MKNTVLILAFLLSSNLFSAEDYTPVFPDRVAFFYKYWEMASGIKIDSVYEESGGTVYELTKNWNFENEDCVIPNGITWAGNKVYVNDKDFYFFNRSGDSILIKPYEAISSLWECYTYNDSSYIEAEVTDRYFMELYDISDTVKIITLNRRDVSGNIVDDSINNFEIAISKNNGFFSLTSFADFPASDSVYTFMGITNPIAGRPFLWKKTIYDFDIGDEFHRKYEHYHYNIDNGNFNITYTNEITTVLNKEYSALQDSVIYTFERYRDIDHQYKYNDSTDEYLKVIIDTIIEIYDIYYQDINIPDEAILPGSALYTDHGDAFQLENHNYDKKRMVFRYQNLFIENEGVDSCWFLSHADGITTESYMEGCGFNSSNYEDTPYNRSKINLVYFKKGDKEWGERLEIKEEHRLNDTQYSIYPNPIENGSYLRISSYSVPIKSLRIINVPGVTVYREDDINSTDYSLNTNGLARGFYLIEIVDINGNVDFEKIVVR